MINKHVKVGKTRLEVFSDEFLTLKSANSKKKRSEQTGGDLESIEKSWKTKKKSRNGDTGPSKGWSTMYQKV